MSNTSTIVLSWHASFWEITRNLESVWFSLDPVHFLLGLPMPNTAKLATKLINHILTAARCLIALKWKQQLPPSHTDLNKRIHNMEYLTGPLNNIPKFNKTWFPWWLLDMTSSCIAALWISNWTTWRCWELSDGLNYLLLFLYFSFFPQLFFSLSLI